MAEEEGKSENEENPEKKEDDEIKGIVRLVGKDLEGSKPIQTALTNLKGIAPSMSRAVVNAAELEGMRKIGTLDDGEVEDLEDVLQNPLENDIPKWMVNRRKDFETGDDKHILGGDIEMTRREDIEREKDMRSRRGIRHQRGLPVRGQRTKSTGRKGMTVGVEREKLKEKQSESSEEEE